MPLPAAVRGRGMFLAVSAQPQWPVGVGGLPACSPALKLICLWTLLCLPRWPSGMCSWPADGVGEGMTTRATLALDVADKLQSLLSEGAASIPPWPSLQLHAEARPCALP